MSSFVAHATRSRSSRKLLGWGSALCLRPRDDSAEHEADGLDGVGGVLALPVAEHQGRGVELERAPRLAHP